MQYSIHENRIWWSRLSKQDKAETIGTMIEKARDDYFLGFAQTLAYLLERNLHFSDKQIEAVRKWYRE